METVAMLGGIVGALVTALVTALVALWRASGREPLQEPNPHAADAFVGDMSVQFWSLQFAEIVRKELRADRKLLIEDLRNLIAK